MPEQHADRLHPFGTVQRQAFVEASSPQMELPGRYFSSADNRFTIDIVTHEVFAGGPPVFGSCPPAPTAPHWGPNGCFRMDPATGSMIITALDQLTPLSTMGRFHNQR